MVAHMKPTPTEIIAEAKILDTIRPKVPQYSAFNDDNHAAINAQIEVLENRMDLSDIDWKDDTQEWSRHEVESAREALDWMDGETEDKPSDGWMPLIK